MRELHGKDLLPNAKAVCDYLRDTMSLTVKKRRLSLGRKTTAPDKHFTIGKRFFHTDNEIDRSSGNDAKPIPGTMSHYCFGFFGGSRSVRLRRVSCFCKSCADGIYSNCPVAHIVAAKFKNKYTPNNLPGGWHEIEMTFVDSTKRANTRSTVRVDKTNFLSNQVITQC